MGTAPPLPSMEPKSVVAGATENAVTTGGRVVKIGGGLLIQRPPAGVHEMHTPSSRKDRGLTIYNHCHVFTICTICIYSKIRHIILMSAVLNLNNLILILILTVSKTNPS